MSHFFAYLAKMKFIKRWGLMRNTHQENAQEHSLQVAMIAHVLAIIRNRQCDGHADPERTAVLALYHDIGEVITGDLVTPIKNLNPRIREAYDEIETTARQRLLEMLPDELKPDYKSLLFPTEDDAEHCELVRAADKICAYLKCLEELKAGNQEFAKAEKAIKTELEELALPEVSYFIEEYMPSFLLTQDELN